MTKKINDLVEGFSNIPNSDFDAKLRLLLLILQEQQKQIDELRELVDALGDEIFSEDYVESSL